MSESEPDVEGTQETTEEAEARRWQSEALEAATGGQILYPQLKDSIWREKDTIIPFESLEWDIHAVHGQARPFSMTTLKQRKEDMRKAMPSSYIHIILWPADIHGM